MAKRRRLPWQPVRGRPFGKRVTRTDARRVLAVPAVSLRPCRRSAPDPPAPTSRRSPPAPPSHWTCAPRRSRSSPLGVDDVVDVRRPGRLTSLDTTQLQLIGSLPKTPLVSVPPPRTWSFSPRTPPRQGSVRTGSWGRTSGRSTSNELIAALTGLGPPPLHQARPRDTGDRRPPTLRHHRLRILADPRHPLAGPVRVRILLPGGLRRRPLDRRVLGRQRAPVGARRHRTPRQEPCRASRGSRSG